MIWFVWFILALEILVIALGLRIMWLMIWEAARAPADPSSPLVHQPKHPPRGNDKSSSRREDEDYTALFALEEVDEQGYVGSRKLHMGCEAGVCRTPFGGRIVAGRHSLTEPQYAWDYASVRAAEKALVHAEFSTHPRDGIIGVEDVGRGSYPAAEPKDYFRRWRYASAGQMKRI